MIKDYKKIFFLNLIVFLLQNIIFVYNVFATAEVFVSGEPYKEDHFSLFVNPSEKINISIGEIDGNFVKKRDASCNWSIPGQFFIAEDNDLDLKLIAPPNKGTYQIQLKIKYKDKDFLKKITIVVLIPLSFNPRLNSYFLSLVDRIEKINSDRMNAYPLVSTGIKVGLNLGIPKTVWSNHSIYQDMPKGIIEVTRENENTYISEHFKLKDFLCKGDRVYPKLICLNYNLIRKLELLINELNSRGHKVNSITIMSGFRTPWYNKKVNVTKFSRHIYGDAVDIYIDMDKNNRMDDLNRDGKVNKLDAKYLADIINEIDLKGVYPGGLHSYAGNKYRGPFVHLDSRGYIIRW